MSKKTQFPPVLYVIREEDGDDTYLLTFESLSELNNRESGEVVAVYELRDINDLSVDVSLVLRPVNAKSKTKA